MFEQHLKEGKIGESEIAGWFKSKGYNILPVYEIEKGQYAGPAVYSASGDKIIAPDMIVFNSNKIFWIEAKHKTGFSWHRVTKRWVTGIDLHHYFNYQKIQTLVDWPIWLMFLHKGGVAKDSPQSPGGLFGNDLKFLSENENHRCPPSTEKGGYGRNGMVYWDIGKLRFIAKYPLINDMAF